MEIICIPGLTKAEVEEYQEKINKASSSEIVVIPANCSVIQIKQS